jgi:hypothetical protein
MNKTIYGGNLALRWDAGLQDLETKNNKNLH